MTEQRVQTVHFDGVCPWLGCPKSGPHDHPVCPTCRAVRWGNIFCPECNSHQAERDAELAELLADITKMKAERRGHASGL